MKLGTFLVVGLVEDMALCTEECLAQRVYNNTDLVHPVSILKYLILYM